MKHTYILAIILFLALILRVSAAFYWDARYDGALFFGDSETYWRLAAAIANGDDYEYAGRYVMRMPGYPLILAPLFWFSESIFIARLQNVLLGTLAVFLVYILAKRITQNEKTALFASALIAVEPTHIVISVLILSEEAFHVFFLLQLIFWHEMLSNKKRLLFSILCGLATAAAVYCRPSWLLFAPFAAALYLVTYRNRVVPHFVMLTVCFLALLPWGMRNFAVSGHFTLTTLQTGASLYDGLNPEATGGSDMRFVEKFNEGTEFQKDRLMKEAAIKWAIANPQRVVELVGIKFVRLWNPIPNEPSFSSPLVQAAVFVGYVPILVFGLIGAYKTFRDGFSYWLLWLPCVYLTLLHVIFVSSIRYRTPALLGLCVLAILGFRLEALGWRKYMSVSKSKASSLKPPA